MTYGGTTYGGSALGEDFNSGSQTRNVRGHVGSITGSNSRDATDSYRLPIADRGADYLLGVESVATDHDSVTLTGLASTGGLDVLAEYLDGDDVTREATAYGAFRRIRRDGTDAVTVAPPEQFTPPFAERDVIPTDASADPIRPELHELELELGLVEPRPRDPLADDGITEQLDQRDVFVSAGTTETVTLSGSAPSRQADYLAEVFTDDDLDSTLVAVSDAAYTLSFSAATLRFAPDQVGRPTRESDTGRTAVTIPVRLAGTQAAELLAVGSRVDAATVRVTPDGQNRAVDTTPGAEITGTVDAPDSLDIDGEYVLTSWSLERDRGPNSPTPFDAELTLVPTD